MTPIHNERENRHVHADRLIGVGLISIFPATVVALLGWRAILASVITAATLLLCGLIVGRK